MAMSMTGYGRDEQTLHGRDITIEIRSVNSRYFEYTSKMPRAFLRFDDEIKKVVNDRVSRGKVELGLLVRDVGMQDQRIAADVELARSYLEAAREVAGALELRDDLNMNSLLRFSDIFTPVPVEQDQEQLLQDILTVLNLALQRFLAMRETEGIKMKEDILSRLNFLENAVSKIEENGEGRVQKYTERLYNRLKTLLEDRAVEESRLLTEAAIFADRTAVDEETVRLRSHIRQYRDTLALSEPVGRKLDFLTQELNRETNTIGSKCQDIEITRLVVDMKAEIEKIREQIQNVE